MLCRTKLIRHHGLLCQCISNVHALLIPMVACVGVQRAAIGMRTGNIILSHLEMDEIIALVQRIDEVDGARQQVHPCLAPFCFSEEQVPLV